MYNVGWVGLVDRTPALSRYVGEGEGDFSNDAITIVVNKVIHRKTAKADLDQNINLVASYELMSIKNMPSVGMWEIQKCIIIVSMSKLRYSHNHQQ